MYFLKFNLYKVYALIYVDFFTILPRMVPENTDIFRYYLHTTGQDPFFNNTRADNQKIISESTTGRNEEAVLVSRTRNGQNPLEASLAASFW